MKYLTYFREIKTLMGTLTMVAWLAGGCAIEEQAVSSDGAGAFAAEVSLAGDAVARDEESDTHSVMANIPCALKDGCTVRLAAGSVVAVAHTEEERMSVDEAGPPIHNDALIVHLEAMHPDNSPKAKNANTGTSTLARLETHGSQRTIVAIHDIDVNVSHGVTPIRLSYPTKLVINGLALDLPRRIKAKLQILRRQRVRQGQLAVDDDAQSGI